MGCRIRLTIFETALVVILAILGTWAVTGTRDPLAAARDPELLPYEQRYGPAKSSAGPEEWLIRDFFRDRRDGVFVDVGAGHYRRDSNTYFLETQLGWTGVAVDALETYADGYRTHRPHTRFLAQFVSDRSGEEARLVVNPLDPRLSSADPSIPGSRGITRSIRVSTITLNDLLNSERLAAIDLLVMDIELGEPAALAGFDLQRFHPALVCVEAHLPVREQLLEYFARTDYVVVGRYLRADRANLYFTPRRSDPNGPLAPAAAPRSQ